MADQEIAISVDKVCKNFKLPHQRKNSVKSVFTGIFERRQNKSAEVQHALKDISFEIKKGEFFGIVGRNGSGKSTLLKMLAGIYQPTEGSVHVSGKLVPFIELGVGFNPELTGRENVYLNGALLGFDQKKIEDMYDDIVEFAELEKFMDQKLKNYSSGMQVRLAFSMAIRADADILLIDEVLAVGDADFQRKCFAYFKSLKKDKKTVVFVSHDMNAVREFCDRGIMIEQSKLIKSGKAKDIADEYVRMFIDQATPTHKVESKRRNGNHNAQIRNVEISNIKLSRQHKSLTINSLISSSIEIDDLIVGFSIKSPSGEEIMGSNTKIIDQRTGHWSKGCEKMISWEIPNIFSEGLHVVDIAVVESDSITVCDWLEAAATFQSYNIENTPYAVSPRISMNLKVVKQ